MVIVAVPKIILDLYKLREVLSSLEGGACPENSLQNV
jgi:hypothetical protein